MASADSHTSIAGALDSDWQASSFEGRSHIRKDVRSLHESDKLREYYEFLSFAMGRPLYLYIRTDSIDFVPELCSIHPVLLQYSTLVRYLPKNWKEEIEGNERVIMDKFCEQCVLEFWSIIASIDTSASRFTFHSGD